MVEIVKEVELIGMKLRLLLINIEGAIPLQNIKFGDKTITYQDKVVGRIMNGRPLLSLSWISQALGYQVQGKGSGTVNIKSNNGGYGFTLAAGDKEVPRYWFGVPVRPVQLFTEPVQSGGEWYVDETDLKNVFGYSLQTLGDISGYGGDIPFTSITNSMNELPPVGGSWGGGINPDNNSSFKYTFFSTVPTNFGSNQVDILMMIEGRVLYHRQLTAELTIRNVQPIVDYSGQGRGEFSKLTRVSPEQAYLETSSNGIVISGAVGSKVGEGLTFLIEKMEDGSYRKVAETTGTFEGNEFRSSIPLDGEGGLYRITARSLLTYPRGNYNIDVAKWYINKK